MTTTTTTTTTTMTNLVLCLSVVTSLLTNVDANIFGDRIRSPNEGGVVMMDEMATIDTASSGQHQHQQQEEEEEEHDKQECLLVMVEELCPTEDCAPPENDGWICLDEYGSPYEISGLGEDFFRGRNRGELVSADTVLSAWPAIKTTERGQKKLLVAEQAHIALSRGDAGPTINPDGVAAGSENSSSGNNNGGRTERGSSSSSSHARRLREKNARRKLSPDRLVGNPTILMVYVNSLDSSPSWGFDAVKNDVLGTNGDTANLMTQYTACSGGKLNFVAAHNPADDVYDGAVNITINHNTIGVLRFTVETYINEYIDNNDYGWKDDYDHVMYILPEGTDWGSNGVLAYAHVNGKISVYNDKTASFIGTQVHEIGHNLFMAHSGANGFTYRDHTCYMGNALGGSTELNKDRPLACFNALKSWYTGWYKEGHQEVPSTGWEGQLVGIDDFNHGRFDYDSGDRTILHIPHPTDIYQDLYVMYNRAKGANVGVMDGINKVVVIQGPLQDGVYTPSENVAQLEATADGNMYMSPAHGYDSGRMIILVHSIFQEVDQKDYAHVEVIYDFSPTAAPTSCTAGDFELELKTDKFPTETSWEVREQGTNILVASGSGYTKANEIYTYDNCFESNGPFEFIITDGYGDGICCSQGDGYYEITFNGQVITGGSFGKTETVLLVETANFDEPDERAATLSPTTSPSEPPTRGCETGLFEFQVTTDKYPGEISWEVLDDDTGSVVVSGSGYNQANYAFPSESYCLGTDGPYTFSINDSYGDGICCNEGNGGYSLTFNGVEIHTGGAYGSGEDVPIYDGPVTPAPSKVPTTSPSAAPTGSPTASPTAAPTKTPSASPTEMNSIHPTSSQSPTASPSRFPTAAPTKAPSASPTKMHSIHPTASIVPSLDPSRSPTTAPSVSPTTSPTEMHSIHPTSSQSPTASPTKAPSASRTVMHSSHPTSSQSPSASPSRFPTAAPSAFPTKSPTKSPSANPTASIIPSVEPSQSPTTAPSMAPTDSPTERHSSHPTSSQSPTTAPSNTPSAAPTKAPSASPTKMHSIHPTSSQAPTSSPTKAPSATPTAGPTVTASSTPTAAPSGSPTSSPTEMHSVHPTSSQSPTASPTEAPSATPTAGPTVTASTTPTAAPSGSPTSSPTVTASGTPSTLPTVTPTTSPSSDPTAAATPWPTYPLIDPKSGGDTPAPTSSPSSSPTPGPEELADPYFSMCDPLSKWPCRGEINCQWQLGTCKSVLDPTFETWCPGKNAESKCAKEKSCIWDFATSGCVQLGTI